MPLEPLRTKSAGVLGVSSKLPPLERTAAAVAAAAAITTNAGRGGAAQGEEDEGGGGGGGSSSGRELSKLGGFTRGIASAPTAGGSSLYSAAAESEGVGGPRFRAVDRAVDRAAGLSVARYAAERRPLASSSSSSSSHGRGSAGGGARIAGAGVLRSGRSLAPIRVENVPLATARISLASLALTPSSASHSGGLDASGGAAGGSAADTVSFGEKLARGFSSCSTPGGANISHSSSGGCSGGLGSGGAFVSSAGAGDRSSSNGRQGEGDRAGPRDGGER